MSQWTSLRDRAAGRWQLPLLAVSLILMIGALLRVRPAPTDLAFNDAVAYLDRLVAGRVFDDAMALCDVLLSREEYTDAQKNFFAQKRVYMLARENLRQKMGIAK